jgi:recombination protein RecA
MAKKKVQETHSTMAAARAAIKKKYGDVIKPMSEQDNLEIQTISTGCISLDAALGRGGMAIGRVYEVYGAPSGGKTTLAMSVIAQAQKRDMQCVFVDAEHSADSKLFKNMGVDLDKLLTIKAFAGDDNLDALEMLMKTNEIDVAVIDSVSALIPKSEAVASISDEFMGLLARLMSKALRKLTPVASATNTLLIFVNQIRSKIGGYGNPETTTGGVALDFWATGRIKVKGGEAVSSRITQPGTAEVVGHYTNFHVKKNKLASPFKDASVPLIYGVGYDTHWETLILAEQLGLVEKSGAWYKHEGANFAQGEWNAKEALKDPDNKELYEGLREKIIDMLGLREFYNEQTSG